MSSCDLIKFNGQLVLAFICAVLVLATVRTVVRHTGYFWTSVCIYGFHIALNAYWVQFVLSDGTKGTIFPDLLQVMNLVYPYFYYHVLRFSLIAYAIVDFFWRFLLSTNHPTVPQFAVILVCVVSLHFWLGQCVIKRFRRLRQSDD